MARLYEVAPDARIIASIRNPAARFFSQVNMLIARGNLPPPRLVTAQYLRARILDHGSTASDMVDRGAYYTKITRNIQLPRAGALRLVTAGVTAGG